MPNHPVILLLNLLQNKPAVSQSHAVTSPDGQFRDFFATSSKFGQSSSNVSDVGSNNNNSGSSLGVPSPRVLSASQDHLGSFRVTDYSSTSVFLQDSVYTNGSSRSQRLKEPANADSSKPKSKPSSNNLTVPSYSFISKSDSNLAEMSQSSSSLKKTQASRKKSSVTIQNESAKLSSFSRGRTFVGSNPVKFQNGLTSRQSEGSVASTKSRNQCYEIKQPFLAETAMGTIAVGWRC